MSPRQKILLICTVSFSLIIFIIIWAVFLNKGQITIEGPSPFEVNIGKLSNKTCNDNKCTYKLSPGTYTVKAYKTDFEAAEISIEMSRGKEMYWEPDFSYMPKIEKLSSLNHIIFPQTDKSYEQNLNELSLILDKNYNLENLPAGFQRVNFAYNGKNAIIQSKSGYYLFDLGKNENKKFIAEKIKSEKWSDQNNLFYIENVKNSEANILKKSDPNGQSQNIVIFQKPFIKPEIFVDNKENFLIIHEENENAFYLIDINKKTRHKINFPQNGELKLLNFANNLVILRIDDKSFTFNISQETFDILDIRSPKEIFVLNENEILIMPENSDELSDGSFIGETSLNNFQIKYPSKSSEIEFDIYNLKEKTTVTKKVDLPSSMIIDKFDLNEGKFYFSSGEDLYEIKLKDKS